MAVARAGALGRAQPLPRRYGQIDQGLFELGPKDRIHAFGSEQRLVQRRVEPEAAQPAAGIDSADAADERHRQPCGGVHRQRHADHRGRGEGAILDHVQACVHARHLEAGSPQPGGGRRQPKRLMAQLVGRDQQNLHVPWWVLWHGGQVSRPEGLLLPMNLGRIVICSDTGAGRLRKEQDFSPARHVCPKASAGAGLSPTLPWPRSGTAVRVPPAWGRASSG